MQRVMPVNSLDGSRWPSRPANLLEVRGEAVVDLLM